MGVDNDMRTGAPVQIRRGFNNPCRTSPGCPGCLSLSGPRPPRPEPGVRRPAVERGRHRAPAERPPEPAGNDRVGEGGQVACEPQPGLGAQTGGDVPGPLGARPDDRRGGAVERVLPQQLADPQPRVLGRPVDRGGDVPGVHGGDRDPAGRLQSEHVGVGGDPALAGRVGGRVRHARDGQARGHVHHVPATSGEVRKRRRRAHPGAEQVHLEHAPGGLVRGRLGRLGAADAGVVDHDVDASQPDGRLGHGPFHRADVRDVRRHEAGTRRQVDPHHRCALVPKGPGRRGSDPAGGAGEDDPASRQGAAAGGNAAMQGGEPGHEGAHPHRDDAEHGPVGHRGRPGGAVMGLAHEHVGVPKELRLPAAPDRDLRKAQLGIGGEIHGQRHHQVVASQADHALPRGLDRHRSGAHEPPLAVRDHRGHDRAAALPGQDLEPVGVPRLLRRIDGELDHDPPRAGRPGDQLGADRVDVSGVGQGQQHDQGQARRGQRLRRHPGPPVGRHPADGQAEHRRGDRDGHRDQDAGEQRGAPGVAAPHLHPAPLRGDPQGPDGQAGCHRRGKGIASPGEPEGQLDRHRGAEVEREPGQRAAQHRADQQGQHGPDGQEAGRGGERPAGSEGRAHRDQGHAGRGGDQHRVVQLLELGHAQVELELERGQPDQHRPSQDSLRGPDEGGVAGARAGLGEEHPHGQRRERRAGDHQQVGRAPHGHVDPVGAVPQVVEGEPDQRAAPQDQQGQGPVRDPDVPEPTADVRLHDGGQQDRDDGGPGDQGQPHQDAQVGGGPQERVAALVHVPHDVPHEADHRDGEREQADEQAARGPRREAAHPLEGGPGAVEHPLERVAGAGRAGGHQPHGDPQPGGQREEQEQPLGAVGGQLLPERHRRSPPAAPMVRSPCSKRGRMPGASR